MAIPTSNAGSTYYNTNQCYSFNGGVSNSAVVRLSSQPCSEVIIWNLTEKELLIYDGSQYGADSGRSAADQALAIPAAAAATPLQPVVIRGLTNADQVSALAGAAVTAGKLFYWRTQFFSSNPRTA